jgi:hypothetical protein
MKYSLKSLEEEKRTGELRGYFKAVAYPQIERKLALEEKLKGIEELEFNLQLDRKFSKQIARGSNSEMAQLELYKRVVGDVGFARK